MTSVDEFRRKAHAWLEDHAAEFAALDRFDPKASRSFRRALWDAGLLGITLDRAYGGLGLRAEHQQAFEEELAAYALPATGEAVTTGICAPTLLDCGTEEQKRRHVGPMLRGDEVWTQLLSEPGAGSDLAGLQTRAVRDGDEWVLNGQKVWTSGAQEATHALCMARTDPDVPKHRGLSMFIVGMGAPGITVRPLRQMTGDAHFNEVFLDDVRVPADHLVGREHDGWRALTTMLTHERLALGAGTGAGGSGQAWARPAADRFVELARRRGLHEEPVVRQELAGLYIAERVLGFLAQKLRDELAAGVDVGARGSLAKLATAGLARRSAELGMALAGPGSQAWDPDDPTGSAYADAMTFAPMRSIAGGTSEIQRNTVGERVLGLPKEPQVDREVPFRDILQNPTR